MVEDVLKSEAPEEDFGRRVLEVLNVYKGRRRWGQTLAELRRIGPKGLPGFIEALKLPHWQSRRLAAQMLGNLRFSDDAFIELLKQMPNDSNKKVRHHAFDLLYVDVDEQRKLKEFLPRLLGLLDDRSGLVRRKAARHLRKWARHVPLEVAARTLAEERHAYTRQVKAGLLRAVLAAQNEKK